jgi:CHAT domain-containing protein
MGIKETNSYQSAKYFLEKGKIDSPDLNKLAFDCGRLVRKMTEKSSSKAIKLGRAFVKRAKPHKGILLQSAYRALGWALLLGGEFSQAERAYLNARNLVKNNAILRAKIDSVLIDIYMYLGDFKKSNQRARMAIKTFQKHNNVEELYRTRVNYANILHRQDRHEEALELYHEAREFFIKKRNKIAAAFCLYNEANALVQLFKFAQAEKLYLKAEKIFKTENYDLRVKGCRYGLAWMHMLQGKYHIALKELLECEENYRNSAQPREVVLCQLDRAETYIGLNLFADARRIAADAEKSSRKLGIQYESAKAALFYAKASLAIGKMTDARKALIRAHKGFSSERNDAFMGATELASIPFEKDIARRFLKIQKARNRFSRAQLPLWEAICDLQILSESPDDKKILNRLKENPAVGAVPHLLARWHTMNGDRLARQGKYVNAAKNWRKACQVLDAVRAKLPPVDLRTSFLKNQGDPYRRLIRSELIQNPITAAAWSEKYKTAGLWQTDFQILNQHPYRDKAEQSLAELAASVTALPLKLGKNDKSRAGTALAENKAYSELQEKIRYYLAEIDINSTSKIDSIENISQKFRSISTDLPIIQFHAGDSDLVAFIHSGNETRFHRYSNGLEIARKFMGQWRFLVERAPFISNPERKSSWHDEKQLLDRIGEWLLSPLELSRTYRRLLIIPEGSITNFPWSAMANKGQPLINSYELIFSPSLRHYLSAEANLTSSKRIEIFVGNTDNLVGFEKDYEPLENMNDNEIVLHYPAFRSDCPNESEALLWHFIGHATVCSNNPFYSTLLMTDGPIYAADFRLKRNVVNLVTLAACRTGQQTFLPGAESTGMVRSFMEMGARNILAGQCAIHNQATTEWMNIFYSNLLQGNSIAMAVKQTTISMQDKYRSAYYWGSFVLYGAG